MPDGTVAIVMRDGITAVVSRESEAAVAQHKWYPSPNTMGGFYAFHRTKAAETIYMHRLVTGAKKGEMVDHINHDTLDNRLSNLRLVSNAENSQNRKGAYRSKNSTGVRGVALEYRNGATYLRPRVTLDSKPHAGPYFPHSKQGLKDAAQWVYDKRRELMPFASHDMPFVSAEALALMPDEVPPRVYARGSAHGMSRLAEPDILEIRDMAKGGMKVSDIAERFGVSGSAVSQIVSRARWAHIP